MTNVDRGRMAERFHRRAIHLATAGTARNIDPEGNAS